MRTSVVTPYAAYLRVYEPLSAFGEAERRRWATYIEEGDTPDPATGMIDERRRALVGLAATPPVLVPPHESQDAFVLSLDDVALVCPLETRLRAWMALEEIIEGLPSAVADEVAAPLIVEQTLADFARWRQEHGMDHSPHILTNAWFVPLRWFIPFVQDERVVRVGRAGADGTRSLYFRTPMVEARRRVARALRVLERTIEHGPVVQGVIELGRWLEEFHPHAWVELDYGGLVHLIDDARLAADCSAADVTEALSALGADDADAAVAAYTRLLGRWRELQALSQAS